MADKPYQLRYLPIFEQDLVETVSYITNVLRNPDAAMWKQQFTNDWKSRYLLKLIVLPENENMTTTEFMLETTPFIML